MKENTIQSINSVECQKKLFGQVRFKNLIRQHARKTKNKKTL